MDNINNKLNNKHKQLFDEMFSLTHSITKSLEITLLVAGLKNCVRQGYYDNEIEKVKDICKKHNINISFSKFKVGINTKDNIENYNSTGIIGDKGIRFVYFAEDKKTAMLANYYETTQNHKEFGKILSYPECCTEFFTQQIKQNNFHPIHPPTNKFTDLSRLHKDVALISHFPCDSNCPHSILIGKNNLEFIEKNLPEIKHFFK